VYFNVPITMNVYFEVYFDDEVDIFL